MRKFDAEAKREYQRKWRAARNADPIKLAKKLEYHRKYQKEWKQREGNLAKARKAGLATYYKYRDKNCEAAHWRNVKKKYGITKEQYDQIVALQGGGCALCGTVRLPEEKRHSVDHCHKSTIVRGILCEACNVLLGRVEAIPGFIEKVGEYLANPPALRIVAATCEHVDRSGLGKGMNWIPKA